MRSSIAQEACGRSIRRSETDSLEGTEGVVDHYHMSIELAAGADLDACFERLADRLLRYDVFPPRLMRATVCSEDGRLREGVTVVQHVAIGPFTLEAGVRVIRAWSQRDADGAEAGFAYVTLQGHPERGVSTFRIRERRDQGSIDFLIDVRSRPGSWLTKLARPIARRFQVASTRAALDYATSTSRGRGPLSAWAEEA